MPVTHHWLKRFRTLHLYLGVFTAPALLFLGFTGGLQAVNLHETTRGSHYKPPAWIVSLSHMHKKQTFEVPAKRPRPAPQAARVDGAAPPAAARSMPAAPHHNPLPMKLFFVLVALSLMLSTLTGLYMSWRGTRHRGRYGAVLAAGVLVPALLLLF